ncbi:MAG: TerB family tellurite resistance protein [Ginsengibacter sp.]
MFYEELYTELGKLFYHLASADGKVQGAEKEALQTLIKSKWKPLEDSADEFGTDLSNLIGFSFDYESSEVETENGFESFMVFYKQNKAQFKPEIIKRILETAEEISIAYRGRNKDEKEFIINLRSLLGNK